MVDGKKFSVSVDKKLCIFCNLCFALAEDVFEAKNDKCVVKKGVDFSDGKIREKAKSAAQSCPTQAIKITETP